MKEFIFLAFALILFFSACVQQQPEDFSCPLGFDKIDSNQCIQKIECKDKCDSTTFYSQGKAENSNCVYELKEELSSKCGYIVPVNACENVSCENKCDGSTWQSNGSCVEGKCVYASNLLNSVKCKYDFNVFVQDCYYLGGFENEFGIFLTIKNLGSTETMDKESIWIKDSEGELYQYYYLNYNYGKNRVLFDRTKWNGVIINWRQKPHQGQLWQMKIENGLKPENNKGFQVIYCPVEADPYENDCDESNGLVLYESTTHACLKELRPGKYFSDENSS